MGKFAIVDHAGKKISLSLIKFRPFKRLLWRLGKRLKIIKSYEWAVFTPKYEIGVFDGGRKAVLSGMPYCIFYYPDTDTANRKWAELVAAVEQDGLDAVTAVMRNGHPREQGFNGVGIERRWAKLFRAMTGDAH
jgi:hypothetical protein